MMSSQERTGLQQPGQTFLPAKLPDVIKAMVPIASKVNQDLLRKVLKVVLKDIEGVSITEDQFANLQSMFTLPDEEFIALYAGLLHLVRCSLRPPVNTIKKDTVWSELTDLRIPNCLIEDICSIVFGERRALIDQSQLHNQPQLPSMTSFRWRIDVTISTSSLNRVLEPTILMEVGNSNGELSTFEVSQSKFHELRYNVAHLLKEMENVEKKL